MARSSSDKPGNDSPERDDLIPSPRSVEEETGLSTAGGYTLVQRLTRAPGADLFEGHQDGSRALVQVVLLRPDHGRAPDRTEAFLQSVARRTEQKLGHEAELLDHGVAARGSGGLALYWTLPWNESARQLRTRGPALDSMEDLVVLGNELLRRLARRHERQILDPLLSESLLVTDRELGSVSFGFPLLIDPRWTDDEMTPPRLAGFEVRDRNLALSPTGDLFRVGRILEELGRPLGPIPPPLWRVIQRLQQRVRNASYPTAELAARELEELDEAGQLGLRKQSLSAPRIASAQTLVGIAPPSASRVHKSPPPGQSTEDSSDERDFLRAEAPRPRSDTLEAPSMQEDPFSEPMGPLDEDDESGSESPTVALNAEDLRLRRRSRSVAPTVPIITASPPQAGPVEPTVEPGPDARKRSERPKFGSSESDATQRDLDVLHQAGPKGTVVGVRLPKPEHFARPLPEAESGTPDLPSARPGGPQGPMGLPPPGSYPGLPQAQLPPSGMLPPAMLPGVLPPGAMPPGAMPPAGALPPGAPPLGLPSGAGDSGGPWVHPRPGDSEDLPDVRFSNRTKLGAAVAALGMGVLALVAVELWVPSEPTPDQVTQGLTEVVKTGPERLKPPRDVAVRVEPVSAILVGEMDGTTLGAGRSQFLVGQEPPAILAAAPGHVPVRVELPQRGSVQLQLVPTESESPCAVELLPPPGVRLEAVAESAEQVDERRWSFRGAALFRAVGGRGAWVVPCPEPGSRKTVRLQSRPPPKDVELQVTWPPRAEVFIDSEPQGRVPVSRMVPNGYNRVRVVSEDGEVERWLPISGPTQVEMPEARPAAKSE